VLIHLYVCVIEKGVCWKCFSGFVTSTCIMIWLQWRMTKMQLRSISSMRKGVREALPGLSPPCLPLGLEFGATLRFLGASFHLFLAKHSFLFLRKDVSWGPLDSKSCWPPICQGQHKGGREVTWGRICPHEPLQPEGVLGLTKPGDYKYLWDWMKNEQNFTSVPNRLHLFLEHLDLLSLNEKVWPAKNCRKGPTW
jgi:hypothetical protein